MIFKLRDLIPHKGNGAELKIGNTTVWVRAMHEPFYDGLIERFRNAWAVITERAVAVEWPRDGEFEQAMELANCDR